MFPLGSDGCKNKPVGEDDSVGGINLLERLLCGEKINLAIWLGNNTLWEEGYSVKMLVVTSLGIPLICYVEGIDRLHWGWEDFAEDDLSVAFG